VRKPIKRASGNGETTSRYMGCALSISLAVLDILGSEVMWQVLEDARPVKPTRVANPFGKR
jgi:hypothetical protein